MTSVKWASEVRLVMFELGKFWLIYNIKYLKKIYIVKTIKKNSFRKKNNI